MHFANLSDNERSSNLLDEKTTRSDINRSSTEKDLSHTVKSKPIKPIFNIGLHKVFIIDKNIVEKLKIDEGDICEQQITEDGYILLKIRRF